MSTNSVDNSQSNNNSNNLEKKDGKKDKNGDDGPAPAPFSNQQEARIVSLIQEGNRPVNGRLDELMRSINKLAGIDSINNNNKSDISMQTSNTLKSKINNSGNNVNNNNNNINNIHNRNDPDGVISSGINKLLHTDDRSGNDNNDEKSERSLNNNNNKKIELNEDKNYGNLGLNDDGHVNYNNKIYKSVTEVLDGYQNNEFGPTGSNGAVAVLNTMNGLFSTKMDIFEKRRKEDRERKLDELYDNDIDYYDRRRLKRNNNSNVCFISVFISISLFRSCAISR